MRTKLALVVTGLALLPIPGPAAEEPSPSLAALTADGYQVKAMSTIGPVMIFLQKEKEPKAYFCAAKAPLGLDPSQYGQVVGSATCTEVRER